MAPELEFSESLEWTVARCLEKKPEHRFTSARELRRALRACRRILRQGPPPAPLDLIDGMVVGPEDLLSESQTASLSRTIPAPILPREPDSRTRWIPAVVAGLVLLVCTVAFAYWASEAEPPPVIPPAEPLIAPSPVEPPLPPPEPEPPRGPTVTPEPEPEAPEAEAKPPPPPAQTQRKKPRSTAPPPPPPEPTPEPEPEPEAAPAPSEPPEASPERTESPPPANTPELKIDDELKNPFD